MSDVFAVTATWDKTSYTKGDTMTAVISGENLHTVEGSVTQQKVGPVDVPVKSGSGAASTISVPEVTVVVSEPGSTVHEEVFIDTTKPVVDTSAAPRQWTVSSDRKSIKATA